MKIFALWFAVVSLAAAAPQHPALPGPAIPDGIGVNIHFTDARPGELEMLAAAGFRWVRMDFAWGGIERKKGEYDFSAYDRLLKSLEEHHLRAIFILDYSNKLYEPHNSVASEAGRQAFARWAAAATTHFKGHGILWEIWNEPNIGFWKPKPDVQQYAALALATAKAIREAAPGEAVIGPASSELDFGFIEACFKAGLLEWWDAVSVHPYRQSGPENVALEYRKLRRLIAQYAPPDKTIPILAGEWGYSAAWKKFDAERQGKMLPREMLSDLANQIPLTIWYDWHDDGKNPTDPEHHFGTVFNEYHAGRDPIYDPKPAYLAAKTFTETFAGFRFVKQLTTGNPQDFAMLFQRGDPARLAFWTDARESQQIVLPSDAGSFEIVTHTGERRAVTADAGRLTLTATDAPQYLIMNKPNSLLAAVPENHPLRVTFVPVTGSEVVVRVENLVDVPFNGRARLVTSDGLEVTNPEQPLTSSASDSTVTLRFSLAAPPKNAYGVGLHIENANHVTIFDVPPRRFATVSDDTLKNCKIFADGDAKVASELAVGVGDAPEPLAGSSAPVLQVTYRMEAGWKFLRVAPQGAAACAIAGEPKAFGLWVYGNGQQTTVRMRVNDAKGQCWQPSGDAINWTGWRYVEFDLTPSTPHWGGPNEDKVHFPLKWDTLFLLDKSQHQSVHGTIYITAPVVVY